MYYYKTEISIYVTFSKLINVLLSFLNVFNCILIDLLIDFGLWQFCSSTSEPA